MADDSKTDPTTDKTVTPVAEGDGGDSSTPPSILEDLALSDEEFAKLPAERQQLTRSSVASLLTDAANTATDTATEKFREEQRAEAERADRDRKAQAGIQSEIDWYDDLNRRRASSDPIVAQEATTEFNEKQARWNDAHAEKAKTSHAVVEREVLASHYNELLPGAEASHEGFTAWLIEHKGELNGNALLGALRYGDETGHARGLTEGHENAEREGVVGKGADGAPGGGNPNAGNNNYLDDIDTKQPGAGREMFRRAAERGMRQ